MEYVFGTKGGKEILKTKGASHTDLTGYHCIERAYPDQVLTDRFCVVRKTKSTEDAEGNCYDWYEISQHSRAADKTGPIKEQLAACSAALDEIIVSLLEG